MGQIGISRGFLGRLARDRRGNTIAIMAAAMMPLAGLIGGGVDMSRLYLAKTRLQQACDAGALAGRKAMGAGSWSPGSNNNSTNDKAEKMFNANFGANDYGTSALTRTFSETDGVVNGTASVTVPMTIMKIFGMTSRRIAVSCTAKMELPNTDVMFVLDVTYSMQCAPSATSDICTPAGNGSRRIDGLKRAVKCFYESLMRVNTPEVCGNDPTATTATTTAQVRLGFVPYGVNVNVGKILPHAVMADDWTYESRVANTATVWTYTLGNESSITGWGGWSATPNDLNNQSTYSGWADVSTSGGSDVNVPSTTPGAGSGNYAKRRSLGQTDCNNLNNIGPSNNKLVAYSDGGANLQNASLQSTTNNPPTYVSPNNPSQQVLRYSQNDNRTATAYKYRYVSGSSGSDRCRLQRATRSYTLSRTGGQSTRSINWQSYDDVFQSWDYKRVSLDVSALKTGTSGWAGTVSLPLGLTTLATNVKKSGETSNSTLQRVNNVSVIWDGCIEEAQTVQNTDFDPSDEWTTRPDDALDMDINLVPSATKAGSYWGPMLARKGSNANTVYGAFWPRYTGSTTTDFTNAEMLNRTGSLTQNSHAYICTSSEARKLQEYRTAGTADDDKTFVGYVSALDAQDYGTYHDIGMLWGARLLSPSGIFAGNNAYASTGGAIQRHLIFMTDGNTRTVYNNYTAYGLGPVSRKQTSYDPVCNGPEPYTCTYSDALVNARLLNICRQVRNMNITLWVVSYGNAVNVETQDRLKECVTPPSEIHYVLAQDTATLTSKFQQIAAKISELRLTR